MTAPSSDPNAVSEPALRILLALGDDAKHGYAIMRDLAAESDGRLRILPGTLYSTIKRMLADGWLVECEAPRGADSDDARRRYYRLTRAGRLVAESEMGRLHVLLKLGRAFLR